MDPRSLVRAVPAVPGLLRGVLVLLAAGCSSPPSPRPALRFDPAAGQPLPAESVPAHPSAPRLRAQHTEGVAGASLFPSPAPEGKSIYFASDRLGGRFHIFRKSPGAAPVTAVTDGPGNDLHPAISPDGRSLAFVSDRDGRWCLYIFDLAGTTPPRRITAAGEESYGPCWSPDSRRIAFFRMGGRTGGWEVWTVDAGTGSEEYLIPGMFPSWSPDGDWIAFQDARGPDGWYSIWKVRTDGRQPTQLVAGEGWGAVHPAWSPDGRWITFSAMGKGAGTAGAAAPAGGRPPDGDIYVVGADGARLVNLTADRAAVAEWNPVFGQDGRIYFNSDEDGGIQIWSLDPGLGKAPRAATVAAEVHRAPAPEAAPGAAPAEEAAPVPAAAAVQADSTEEAPTTSAKAPAAPAATAAPAAAPASAPPRPPAHPAEEPDPPVHREPSAGGLGSPIRA